MAEVCNSVSVPIHDYLLITSRHIIILNSTKNKYRKYDFMVPALFCLCVVGSLRNPVACLLVMHLQTFQHST